MSWSASKVNVVDINEFDVDDPRELAELGWFVSASLDDEETRGQILTALASAKRQFGEVTREGDAANVTISGHTNPGKAPRPGWADQYITVAVTQVPAENRTEVAQ